MNSGQTFDRVYSLLKQEIQSGRLRPGDRIDPSALTTDLAASVTPVRDALYRLAGERQVLALPALGFRMPLLTEPALRDLYAWNETIMLIAAKLPTILAPADLNPDSDLPDRTRALFDAIAGSVANVELRMTIHSNNDRLHAARRYESPYVGDAASDLRRIETAWRQDDRAELKKSIRAYHRLRQRIAGYIVEALNRG
jgi:DNA-binding GntR family transcriptional regulator